MAQVTGTIIVRLDGVSLRSDAKATMSLGGKERKSRYADHGLVGFSETPIAASIKATLLHTADTDLQLIADARNVTLMFETDTGKRYTIRGAYSIKPPELTGSEGEVSVEFEGQAAVET
jgi:hypothetical protein